MICVIRSVCYGQFYSGIKYVSSYFTLFNIATKESSATSSSVFDNICGNSYINIRITFFKIE